MDTKNYIKEPGVLASYLYHLVDESDVSTSTAYNYYMNLRLLAQYLKHERKDMDCEPDEVVMVNVSDDEMLSITEDEWDDFLDYCRFTRNESTGSYAVRISIVRGFYCWLCEVHASDVPVFIAQAKRPHMVRTKESVEVNEEQKDTIIEHLTGDFATRNASIILLFLRCGLGLNEIVQLDMEDIDLTSVRVERGDDGKSRVVQMDEETAEAIDAYLSDRIPPTTGGNPLFVSAKKGRMRHGTVQKMLRRATKIGGAGIKDISIRDLQSTARGRIMDRAATVEDAMQQLPVRSPYYFHREYTARMRENAESLAKSSEV